jgi:AcrR family transcriptional regulator
MADKPALSAERIVDAAAAVADAGGLAKVSMRSVGRELGVEAMSLYHHVAGKEALLDGLASWVFARIEPPAIDRPWRPAMTDRAHSARAALLAHPWGLGLIESRRPGPALLDHHEAVLGNLRANGFPLPLAASAFSALDAYTYGFVLTEISLPFGADDGPEGFVGEIEHLIPADRYPRMVEMMTEQVMRGGYAYGDEFVPGLDLILDGLERRLATEATDAEG